MQLGRWIAQYYIAPVGEVFRTMLPLSAEFRRVLGYRITDKGIDALHAASTSGSSLRSRKEPEHQMLEYAVLNRLADGEITREATLRSTSGASRAVLQTLLRKKWIAREDLSDVRDASRTVQIATLKQVEGKLNANQQTIVDYLRRRKTSVRRSKLCVNSPSPAPRCKLWCAAASSNSAKRPPAFTCPASSRASWNFFLLPHRNPHWKPS